MGNIDNLLDTLGQNTLYLRPESVLVKWSGFMDGNELIESLQLEITIRTEPRDNKLKPVVERYQGGGGCL